MFKRSYIFIFFLLVICSCSSSDLSEAISADKYGNTDKAVKYLNKYLNDKNDGEIIDTSNEEINALQAKRLVANINTTIESESESLSADDYRKLLKRMENHKNWDHEEVIFSLTKAKIEERLSKIDLECKSLENILNIFLQNGEKIKAYKTYNFIKEKDSEFGIAPLTEIKIIDIFVAMNEKYFYKNLREKNFEEIANFFNLIDEQFFSKEHKEELRNNYYTSLEKIILPEINKMIEKKYFLNAFIINNETINDEKLRKKIQKELKTYLLKDNDTISYTDFITLEGYLIIYPDLKKYVETEYYSKIDSIVLPQTTIAMQLKNYKLKKDLYSDIKTNLKEELGQMTIPIVIKQTSSKNVDYQINVDIFEITDNKLNSKISITKLLPKKENIINQTVSSRFDVDMQEISVHKLVKKLMHIIRQNIKLDTDTMLKSARYYLLRKDLKHFEEITKQLILLNHLESFSTISKNKLIKLLSEYEKYGKN